MNLRMTLLFVGFLLATALTSRAHERASHESQPFKVGICDWSANGRSGVESFYFAKQHGLRGIQYSFGAKGVGIDLRTRKNRDRIRKVVRETGVAISSLAIGLLNKTPLATTGEAEQLVNECLETMAKLKQESLELGDAELAKMVAPKIVLLAFFGKADINGKPELIEVVIKKLKRFAPIAEHHGFVLGLESLLSEADHRYIIQQVGSPAVKVYYDTANSARMGYDIYSEIASLGAENICEIHLKENGALLGKGNVDFDRVKLLLKEMKYQGWLIIEGSRPKEMSQLETGAANSQYAISLFAPLPHSQTLDGDWSLELDSKTPAWMSIQSDDSKPVVFMRLHVGPAGPHQEVEESNGRLRFTLRQNKRAKTKKIVEVGIQKDMLDGVIVTQHSDGSTEHDAFTGKKIPPCAILSAGPVKGSFWATDFSLQR